MIETRLWLHAAKSIPCGSDDKIIHKGCGDRPSLWVFNEPDRWGCYCHRCRQRAVVFKEHPRVKVKVPPKTGYIPDDLTPLMGHIVQQPHLFSDTVKYQGLGPYLSLLDYSKKTGRIYAPDTSKSYLGLDATGKANARFYSPMKRNLCTHDTAKEGTLYVECVLKDYLQRVAAGDPAILCMNTAAEKAALARIAESYSGYEQVVVSPKATPHFKLNVRPFI